MNVKCKHCGEVFTPSPKARFLPTYCSTRCRVAAYRARKREAEKPRLAARPCAHCGKSFTPARKDKVYCSRSCKQRARYQRGKNRGVFPEVMARVDRWVRADGKRPIQVNGRAASSTNPATWSSYDAVRRSSVGNGFGVMLGGGLGCYDLDHMSDSEAREFIAGIAEPILFVERSVSGHGVHVFIRAPESKGMRRGRIERYTRFRFIRVTGNVFA